MLFNLISSFLYLKSSWWSSFWNYVCIFQVDQPKFNNIFQGCLKANPSRYHQMLIPSYFIQILQLIYIKTQFFPILTCIDQIFLLDDFSKIFGWSIQMGQTQNFHFIQLSILFNREFVLYTLYFWKICLDEVEI